MELLHVAIITFNVIAGETLHESYHLNTNFMYILIEWYCYQILSISCLSGTVVKF